MGAWFGQSPIHCRTGRAATCLAQSNNGDIHTPALQSHSDSSCNHLAINCLAISTSALSSPPIIPASPSFPGHS